MIEVRYQQGIHLPGLGIWMDPRRAVDCAVVTHAHSDHTAAHNRILCTAPTAKLIAARIGLPPDRFEILEFGRPRKFGENAQLTLLPAGHVLGSAQVYVESPEGTLLYTGDFKLRQGLSCELAQAVHAETLIIETTYGLPHYRFPPPWEVIDRVKEFCAETLEDGGVPVLLGYSLGKAQEILAALGDAGFSIMLHGTVAKLVAVYEEYGVKFPKWRPWESKAAQNHVLICPPSAVGSRTLRSVKGAKLAALTGWALDPGARFRLGVDEAFPLSDHSDFDDLLAHVQTVNPLRVLTLHGFASEFAATLRARKIDAWALTGPNQLELGFDDLQADAFPRRPQQELELGTGSFDGLAGCCEQIKQHTGRLAKIEILSNHFARLTDEDLEWTALWLTGRALPAGDSRRLGVGPVVLRKALALAAGIPEEEVRSISRALNDTGVTAVTVLSRNKLPKVHSLEINKVRSLIDRLASAQAAEEKINLLAETLQNAHPVAGSYLVRILTGDLRMGLKEGLVEEGIARASSKPLEEIRLANMLAGHPGRVAVLARKNRLNEVTWTPFHPIGCMLAGVEPDAQSLWQRLGGAGSVWLEPKLDGIRCQMHVARGQLRIFSREMRDVTESFPEVAKAGRTLPDCVLDGEILAWEGGQPLPFFELQKRLGRRGEDLFFAQPVPVAYRVFDILAYKGNLLIRNTLRERRKILTSLELAEPLATVDFWLAGSAKEIDAAFERARSLGHEGLVAKDPASPYTPGRRGFSWVKLKKELATLDVVVTAAEFGHGRRSRVLSDLTFAVRHGHTFLDIGKAYTGLTDEEIEALTAKFLAEAIESKGNKVILRPELVIEVSFDSVQVSERHPSGLALRFPRIKRLRPDKKPDQVDTLAAARRLAKCQCMPAQKS